MSGTNGQTPLNKMIDDICKTHGDDAFILTNDAFTGHQKWVAGVGNPSGAVCLGEVQPSVMGHGGTPIEAIMALSDKLGVSSASINKSGIKPLEYRVLVLPKEVETKTSGGLLLPETKVEKDGFQRREGILVDMSPMAFAFPDWPADHPKPKIGDRVMFARYQADEVMGKDGQNYWLMADKSVLAIIEE